MSRLDITLAGTQEIEARTERNFTNLALPLFGTQPIIRMEVPDEQRENYDNYIGFSYIYQSNAAQEEICSDVMLALFKRASIHIPDGLMANDLAAMALEPRTAGLLINAGKEMIKHPASDNEIKAVKAIKDHYAPRLTQRAAKWADLSMAGEATKIPVDKSSRHEIELAAQSNTGLNWGKAKAAAKGLAITLPAVGAFGGIAWSIAAAASSVAAPAFAIGLAGVALVSATMETLEEGERQRYKAALAQSTKIIQNDDFVIDGDHEKMSAMLLGQAILGSIAKDQTVHAKGPIWQVIVHGQPKSYGHEASAYQLCQDIDAKFDQRATELKAAGHDDLALHLIRGKDALFKLLEADPVAAFESNYPRIMIPDPNEPTARPTPPAIALESQAMGGSEQTPIDPSASPTAQTTVSTASTVDDAPSNRAFESREELNAIAARLAQKRAAASHPAETLSASHTVVPTKRRGRG